MADICEVDAHISKRYDVKKRLGKGAYGIVWKAVDKKNGSVVAVKKIFDAFRNQTDAQRTFREIMFLQHFGDHPNVIRLLDVHRADNDKDIYLVFEYMDTDLHNVIKRGNILKDVHKQYIVYQLFRATKYLHSGNVIHRDQKPSNILLDADCRCKMADFGLARSLVQDAEDKQGDSEMTDYVATRWYRAPEILLASKRYTKGVDMWSLGCILGEILLGQPLFPGTSTLNQLEKIMASIPPPSRDDIQSLGSGYASSLLEKSMMVPRQPLRTLLAAAPADAVDLLEKLLVLNPHKRFTAEQALEHPYVRAFHKPEREPALDHDVVPTLSDAIQLTVEEYRSKLYELIAHQKRSSDARQMSPFKFIRDPHSPAKDASAKTFVKTKSSADLIDGKPEQTKKHSNISAPGDVAASSSRSNRSSAERKLSTRHSDEVLRGARSDKSSTSSTTTKATSTIKPTSNLPRSHSGHALVKYSLSPSNSSTESDSGKTASNGTANGKGSSVQWLAANLEHQCSVAGSRQRPSATAPAGPSTAASRFAARYDKHVFSRSLDNPVITRTTTVPRATSVEKALGNTKQSGGGSSSKSSSSSPAPTFGKRQFASLHNVSSAALAGKFVASHGSLAASALQELRQSIK